MSFRTVYGNTTSENGWRMCNRDECDIPRIPELYLVDTAPLRKGAPLTILGAWLYWYDRNVEEITSPVWGWSDTNDVGDSNHLAGTAVDVMAPKYPWQRYTMDAATQAKVRAGQKLFSLDGTVKNSGVYWGRDWSRPDEMHYQMAWPEGDKRNDELAAKLRAGYLGIYAPAQPAAPVQKRFPQDLSDRELLEYIAEQLGPGHPDWASKGMTLRDKVWSK